MRPGDIPRGSERAVAWTALDSGWQREANLHGGCAPGQHVERDARLTVLRNASSREDGSRPGSSHGQPPRLGDCQRDTGIFHIYNQRPAAKLIRSLSLLWYDKGSAGSWSYGLPLDRSCVNDEGAWTSMQSSLMSPEGLFIVMKAAALTGYSAHGLDVGHVVLDALGERWTIELCQRDYLSVVYSGRT
ncbi:Uu.00g038920.m01.CDS01 [Anthostomella pinea]|uniref:Uu.00g038920.m01.CDS01 n=1 Tax=Anthostomella pinea TaxID=933095 RepID=A0AAI8V9S4_9PEZI|nr:Uu.00g038920.m01.CDS01 [Anthostomella pinea]